jgi:hypothetical protein
MSRKIFLLAVLYPLLAAPSSARAQDAKDVASEMHEFTQLTLSAGRCERHAANSAVQSGGEETADAMVKFVLDTCESQLLKLQHYEQSANMLDTDDARDSLITIAMLLGAAEQAQDCSKLQGIGN